MASNKNKVFVVGVGMTKFEKPGRREGRDYPQMASGAVLVAALALLIDFVLSLVQRYTVSRGVSGRYANVRTLGTEPALTDVQQSLARDQHQAGVA